MCFQVSVWPAKRGNRADSSRNESDFSRRRIQISFPRLEMLREFRAIVAHFSIFLPQIKSSQTEPPVCSTAAFLNTQFENNLARNYLNCDPPEPGNRSGYLSESGQTYSEKSPLDLPALRGKTSLKATDVSVCNLTQIVPQKERSNDALLRER